MNAARYPEVPAWRGFGWMEAGGQWRVLGMDFNGRVRVEWFEKKGRPREWVSINDPRLAALKRHAAKWPPTPRPEPVVDEERQRPLFAR